MEETITVKKGGLWKYASFIVVIVLVVGVFMFMNASGGKATGNVVNGGETGAQQVTLSMKNNNYYPNTITVKAGQPVSITLDKSIQGCFRSFTIKDLGVKGYSQNPSQTIDFTPTKKGTFRFACSMGMGYGNIVIE
ncbi:MAG TPA: cupredoxin domain-containing protein [Candidatus Nanoarchaeia archaeon]|nr:cupredoxin domain-containing protein [Candidatus Nanoarchaeia archaeon]